MNTRLRHNEYYDMQNKFDELYSDSQEGKTFTKLYDDIISEENILLAYRSIKGNKGSGTAGTDTYIIDNYKQMNRLGFIELIRNKLMDYRPGAVRRVMIPKSSGGKRPLGIPTMIDRLIQQMFKQILEPICEARFYKHSYGFRPLRSAHHALARSNFLINISKLNYVVDIDIKGFFDNVNHRMLIKQLWNLGIRDSKVLTLINKMLKAPIKGEGIPTKGTPQGGILSPLLSNVVLNDLDQWVASQWENFETRHQYSQESKRYLSLKRKSNLKEGYIVRYADDFKIFARDYKTAYKWFHAVKEYLKKRLGLDISPEKSRVINLRKRCSDFLGFQIRAVPKKGKHVSRVFIHQKKKDEIVKNLRIFTKNIQRNTTHESVRKYNAYVAGVQNYFRYASMVGEGCTEISHRIARCQYNRLRKVAKLRRPNNPSALYKKRYSLTYKTWAIADIHLFPIANMTMKESRQFDPTLTIYNRNGRLRLQKSLEHLVETNIHKMMRSVAPNRSLEFVDNRLSRYSMKRGLCEISGVFLDASEVECHHYTPVSLGGTDKFENLRIIHADVHKLIHATRETTKSFYLQKLKLDDKQLTKVNQYRKKCQLDAI